MLLLQADADGLAYDNLTIAFALSEDPFTWQVLNSCIFFIIISFCWTFDIPVSMFNVKGSLISYQKSFGHTYSNFGHTIISCNASLHRNNTRPHQQV